MLRIRSIASVLITGGHSPARSLSTALPDIIVTSKCAQQINHVTDSDPNKRLRVGIDPGGCEGFEYFYTIEDATETNNDVSIDDNWGDDSVEDILFERDGAVVVVDGFSLDYLRGSTVDFVESMMSSSFQIVNNPNASSACGCGSSFAAKKFAESAAAQ